MSLPKDFVHYMFLKWFKYKYKKTKIISNYFSESVGGFYSQGGQDAYIYSEFFSLIENGRIPRLFVDIGCNHPIEFNNSYFFEKHLKFECIAVDPLTAYVSKWSEIRPNAKLHSIALGATSGTMSLLTPASDASTAHCDHSSDMFSTMSADHSKLRGGNWISIEVPVLTAQELFDTSGVSEIGIASIDVEGFEMEVLKGINFSRTKIHIVLVENNTGRFGTEKIRTFMAEKGFTFYARIWGLDDIYVNNNISAP